MRLIVILIVLTAILVTPVSAQTKLQYIYEPEGSWEFTNCRQVEIGGQFSMICVNGNIVLADNSFNKIGDTRHIRVFSTSGKLIRKWGSFKRPAGIVRDKPGNYYVLDSQTSKVYKYSSKYKPIKSWGGEGIGEGQMKFPTGIAIDINDCLYVCDKSSKRVTKFSTDGKYLGQFGEDVLQLPLSIAADKKGNIWVADKTLLRKFDQKGKPIDSYNLDLGESLILLSTIAVAPDGIVHAGTLSNPYSMICGINPNGELISASMSASQAPKGSSAREQDYYDGAPSGICFIKDKMYVVDAPRFRIMVFHKHVLTAAEKRQLESD